MTKTALLAPLVGAALLGTLAVARQESTTEATATVQDDGPVVWITEDATDAPLADERDTSSRGSTG